MEQGKTILRRSTDDKFRTIIELNTFWYYDQEYEDTYEGRINALKENLLLLRNRVQNEGLSVELVAEFLYKRGENGLKGVLALTGFSYEYLKRVITFIRISNNPELNALVYRDQWIDKGESNQIIGVQEWGYGHIQTKIRKDKYFRLGIATIFMEGASMGILSKALPLFYLKKLSCSKLNFEVEALLDSLVRYKEGGAYSAGKGKNPEQVIEKLLAENNIRYEKGDLSELIDNAPNKKRTMDFIIPDKFNPKVVIESSYMSTTASNQGDKSKTEIQIDGLIKQHYPDARFWGFVDGIGWYVRKQDLRRMVDAYEDVFTFHDQELERFQSQLLEVIK